MKVFSSRRRKWQAVLLVVAASIAGTLAYQRLVTTVPTDPERVAALIGPYGPAGILATQFAQVLIAPIPPVTPVVSGTLYGVWEGTFYSTVGAALGSLAAILVARRYGRSTAEKFLSEEAMDKFDDYTSGHGYMPFIVLFVLPGFPDDALCFIAGLTSLDWKKLFLIASLGRIPGIMLLATTGSSAAHADAAVFAGSAASILAISYLSVKYEKRIENMLRETKELFTGYL